VARHGVPFVDMPGAVAVVVVGVVVVVMALDAGDASSFPLSLSPFGCELHIIYQLSYDVWNIVLALLDIFI
jgi:hypothetical protein